MWRNEKEKILGEMPWEEGVFSFDEIWRFDFQKTDS